jgi:MoaA/NifB/PqqE/SkfB family radical SAM enzyme
MTPKDILTNKSFCPIPWTGFYIGPDGQVKNCICSWNDIGNTKEDQINNILTGEVNTQVKREILADKKPSTCEYCYSLETNKTTHNIVSSRIYYLKELKTVPLDTYTTPENFNLHQIDIRWRNTCNFACAYCGPTLSSKWAEELKVKVDFPDQDQFNKLKSYVFSHAAQLKNIYMAGGEPLLIKENEELLELLLEKNPDVTIRVNTNLSKTNTRVLDLLCKFKNVHWTLSAENINNEFEYLRYGGKWKEFLSNLELIRSLPHKITFNMVWCILNYYGIFDCIDYLRSIGFHPNAFILTAAMGPDWLDTRHLPNNVLQSIENCLLDRINEQPGFLLEDGYQNLLTHIHKPFDKNLELAFDTLAAMDQRRGVDSSKIFTELYKLKEGK